jgi:uncharacterized protein YjbI with pentapeptide repeats
MNKEATAPMKTTYLFIPNNEPKHLIGAVLETADLCSSLLISVSTQKSKLSYCNFETRLPGEILTN